MKKILFLLILSISIIHVDAGEPENSDFLIPELSKPWKESRRILGDGTHTDSNFFSDFFFIKDKEDPPRWHAIGIFKMKTMKTLYHAVSESLFGKWDFLPEITSDDPVDRMWAPFAIWNKEGDKAYMYYHHKLNEGAGSDKDQVNSLRALVADFPSLNDWRKMNVYGVYPEIPGIRNIAFRGGAPRDACIFFDENVKKYLMYYADNYPNAIRIRTSDDAVNWSDPVDVMSTPFPTSAYVTPESPFVVYKDGLYYLFVCGFDYALMALYVSEDPFNFGDPEKNKITEINGHAPEIVYENGKYYIACAHISSEAGKAPGEADLWGTYIQELKWVKAKPEDKDKIVRIKKYN